MYALGDGISFEQEMEKRAEWAALACSANQAISLFPVQTSKLIPSLGIIIDQLRSVLPSCSPWTAAK